MRGWAVAGRILPGGVAMGRSFESIRMGVRDVSATAMAYNETIINHALAFLFYPKYGKRYMLLVG